ncbi:uncharacterized protein EDB91DRAFT_1086395 [Suillus paluster]|uniref:uncharacterized protein n=1 Tax=Suillus paluster TaxID=48578 RepID=UPI001B885AC6|nr:uncharacterized protein EDB91DRAFT_1086395 [Suillus paluster]KAG1727453.1 hypothetical protein EDB91DRAFT_1086395 [Suillus paluster]
MTIGWLPTLCLPISSWSAIQVQYPAAINMLFNRCGQSNAAAIGHSANAHPSSGCWEDSTPKFANCSAVVLPLVLLPRMESMETMLALLHQVHPSATVSMGTSAGLAWAQTSVAWNGQQHKLEPSVLQCQNLTSATSQTQDSEPH